MMFLQPANRSLTTRVLLLLTHIGTDGLDSAGSITVALFSGGKSEKLILYRWYY